MVSHRSIWMAACIALGVARVGSAPAANLNWNLEAQEPTQILKIGLPPNINLRNKRTDDRWIKAADKQHAHELLGTVNGQFGNVLSITLDQDDPLGGAKKGDTITVAISANTHVRTGDRFLPGTQVFIAASPDGIAWAALDVRERRPAPVAEEPATSPSKRGPPPLSPRKPVEDTNPSDSESAGVHKGTLVGRVESVSAVRLVVVATRDLDPDTQKGTLVTFLLTQSTQILASASAASSAADVVPGQEVTVEFIDRTGLRVAQIVRISSDRRGLAEAAPGPTLPMASPAPPDRGDLWASRDRLIGGGEGSSPPSSMPSESSQAAVQQTTLLLNEARELMAAERPAEALEKLTQALALDPAFADAYYDRGSYYGRTKQYDLAIADFEKAVQYAPSSPGAYNNIARIYHLKGEKDKAFQMLDRSLTTIATNPQAYMLRGLEFLELGKIHDGEEDLAYAERLQPGVTQGYATVIAEARAAKPRPNRPAAEMANKTLDHAMVLVITEQDRKATYVLDGIIAREPGNALAYLQRAKAHYNLKQFTIAQEDVAQALRLKPQDAEAHRILGRCLEVRGKGDAAIEEYTKAISLNPEGAIAYVDRSVATFKYHPNLQGTALADLEAALKVDPRNPYAWYNRAGYAPVDFQDPRPNWDFQIYNYTKAIEAKPDFASAYGMRGVAYLGKYMDTNDPALELQGRKDIEIGLRLKPQLQATLDVMLDDVANIQATTAYLRRTIKELFDTTTLRPSRPSSGAERGGPCSGFTGGAAGACGAGDYYATERYKAGNATGDDRRKYGDY